MKLPLINYLAALFFIIGSGLQGQDLPWLTSFEEREELSQIIQLSNSNYLLSGRTFEIGNKSDLVILIGWNGKEIKRKVICETCSFGDIIYSKETANGEILHVRSSGDILVSDINLDETRLVYNIKGTEFDNVEIYQVLQNVNYIVVVSYAVKDGVRGLLHTTINTVTEEIISHKFNSTFPDISGSIGIGLFKDIGVVDGYNTFENSKSAGNLIRFDINRNILWDAKLDYGNIRLEHVLVSYAQEVYAVGTIEDESNPDHWQGFLVKFDKDGNQLWEQRYDAPFTEENGFINPTRTITKIVQLRTDKFILLGVQGGRKSGGNRAEAFVISIDDNGEITDEFAISKITDNAESVDVVINPRGELIFVAKAYATNGIAGSFVSIARNVSSAYTPLPSGFSMYPNPAQDYLVLDTETSVQDMKIEVYSIDGKLVQKQSAAKSISVSNLDRGVYYLALFNDQNRYVHKFVKE